MKNLNETQIFITVRNYFLENDWQVIGGQPPSGTDYLQVIEIRDPSYKGKGSNGAYKPDLIAWHEFNLFIIELKPSFNQPDRDKVNEVLQSPERVKSLWESLIQRNISVGEFGQISAVQGKSRVVGGLGYGGTTVEHPELWRFFVKDGKVEVTPGSFSIDFN